MMEGTVANFLSMYRCDEKNTAYSVQDFIKVLKANAAKGLKVWVDWTDNTWVFFTDDDVYDDDNLTVAFWWDNGLQASDYIKSMMA